MRPDIPSYRLELAINAPALLQSSPRVEEIERVQKLTQDEITQWLAQKRKERLSQKKSPEVLPANIVYRPAPLDPDLQNATAIQLVARRIDAQLQRTRTPVPVPVLPTSIVAVPEAPVKKEQTMPEQKAESAHDTWHAQFTKVLMEKELLRESD